jgi:hypothetical protein
MNCDRCGVQILTGEEMDYYGRMLCEDCYMQALSPVIACDPWAVRSAKTLSQMDKGYLVLSEIQAKILQVLKETGGAEPTVIAQRLQMKLPELERELATLRHMEKVRGRMQAGQKIVCLWEA